MKISIIMCGAASMTVGILCFYVAMIIRNDFTLKQPGIYDRTPKNGYAMIFNILGAIFMAFGAALLIFNFADWLVPILFRGKI